ncbi:MAG: cell division topological specificity factor MinE [Deltaproteobacteria bacterium HGW-Deltaproteobacteria-15]|jgi:cell division topological specificity factor|nr:MAG: cell division topological specificity factor MinE [Deltaproteobacteria bacterium HGW-Deltaproteobacteria-15]
MLAMWFRRFIGKNNSKEVAKTRLRFALICDKLDVSNDILSDLQREIVEVISKYFEVDKDDVKLKIRKKDDLSLVLKTPIGMARRRERRA